MDCLNLYGSQFIPYLFNISGNHLDCINYNDCLNIYLINSFRISINIIIIDII